MLLRARCDPRLSHRRVPRRLSTRSFAELEKNGGEVRLTTRVDEIMIDDETGASVRRAAARQGWWLRRRGDLSLRSCRMRRGGAPSRCLARNGRRHGEADAAIGRRAQRRAAARQLAAEVALALRGARDGDVIPRTPFDGTAQLRLRVAESPPAERRPGVRPCLRAVGGNASTSAQGVGSSWPPKFRTA